MTDALHPFWAGAQLELTKSGFVEGLAEFILGLQSKRIPKPVPPPPPAGYGWKGMLGAAVAGGLGAAAMSSLARKLKSHLDGQDTTGKVAFINEAIEHPGIVAGVGAVGLGAGALTVHGLRKTFNEGRPLGVPRPPPAKPGIKPGFMSKRRFGFKGLAVAGLAGAAATLYGAHKLKERREQEQGQ